MSNDLETAFEFVSDTLRKLELNPTQIGNITEKAAQHGVEKVQSQAEFVKGYSKGAIKKDGIAYQIEEDGTASIGWTADEFYGRFVEDGTEFQQAQPYLRPTLESETEAMMDIVAKEIEKLI
ncbi:HK97-gp10 family putative phage morphogenesis protein [Culicoidibacter larvae]|uniref:HK97 gp10 family phage protein n=1 Tax=Culicoidibacter larvae TaxID=2579976 RepID=A0A5R8QAY2_9FIRM|nr:HK97-gp10 family putative phage morphogenesis protein [Culicoidibacter larvae]TLG72050.1 hypothetical protein FEZ08_09460 [Culicoidibacter larvae]